MSATMVETEVLSETDRARITRVQPVHVAGGAAGAAASVGSASLIRKERRGRGAMERARHELRMLERLAGVPGVLQLAAARGADELLFDDVHGVALTSFLLDQGPAEVGWCTGFAAELARIVGAVHDAGVIHRDISPANVLAWGPARRPLLIDFDLANTFGEEHPGFAHHREIVGTLPYLAPEQTGRTGMPVDERADLYALGATMYELLTGRPLFAVGDPLRMLHDTLAGVPVPPVDIDARIPRQLSDILLRLLEKEPDHRYQSADGLAHDLSRLHHDLVAGRQQPFPLGERDFPRRLSPPAHLVGRDAETAALRRAFGEALVGRRRVVLVTGAPGAGKSTLINGLRSVVTAHDGWFVTGKFDQYRQDTESGALGQAFGSLGRLLLGGTDAEVEVVRARIASAAGPNLGLLAVVPEFAALLGVVRSPTPMTMTAEGGASLVRLQQALLELLSAVASPQQPLVMVLDDLQWAGAGAVAFIDAVLGDDRLAGVLVVGAYRDREVGPAHPLAAALARWERLGTAPTVLRLDNLPRADLAELLAVMLRLPASEAPDLADAIGARSGGNPFDTVELVNALRRDGALVAGARGWSWDASSIRRFVGEGDVVDLLAARIDLLPDDARRLLAVMACLGGAVERAALDIAAGLDPTTFESGLLALLEDGLVVGPGDTPHAVQFRHDRVQQAAYSRLSPARRNRLHLAAARRLAAAGRAGLAAEQYLQALVPGSEHDAAVDDAERRAAAGLFVTAGTALRLLQPTVADRFLGAAITVLDAARPAPPAAAADGSTAPGTGVGPSVEPADPLLAEAERQRHGVLYSIGRLVEADTVYGRIERRAVDPLDLVEPACTQLASLANRGRPQEAVDLAMTLFRRLGLAVPAGGRFDAVAGQPHDELLISVSGPEGDLARPEVHDRQVLLTAALLNAVVKPSYFCDPSITAWLFATSQRLWVEHGPCAPLVAMLGGAATTTIMLWDDYRTGHAIAEHVLAVGASRGYEPETSYARNVIAITASPWFEPLEDVAVASRAAREGFVRGGDLQLACYSYFVSLAALFESSRTLDAYAADVESALAFAARTGNDYSAAAFLPHRQLLRALRGETAEPGGFRDTGFDEASQPAGLAANPMARTHFHVERALAAALFNDPPGLVEHAGSAIRLVPYVTGFYAVALAHLLQGLALAELARAASPAERPLLLVQLDSCRDWMIARAADCPVNFAHLVTLLTAERARATGDSWTAARAYDDARREVAGRQRPWHRALITERAALFHLTDGLPETGRDLMGEARHLYAAWGATGKVRVLESEYPTVARSATRQQAGTSSRPATTIGSGLSTDELDMLAILHASQALSSETSLDRLRVRLGELLKSMTGASRVLLTLRGDASEDWVLWDTTGGALEGVPLAAAAAAGLAPLSAIRYAERTLEPLLVRDAAQDDRFARDPYLAGLERCSLLVVPILSQGRLRAVLVLENRARRGAFAEDRLDAVLLVTGQLTVSLDNAQLYASLERKVADRTAALGAANRQLEVLSRTDALTGLGNRRHFDATLDAEWRRAVRQGTPLGLAMIDVDHFKAYNDTYGHLAGDDCLRSVARTFRVAVRSGPDALYRYGGEEFAAILPGTDRTGCLLVAERIRSAIAAMRHPHLGNQTLTESGILTVSVGVAIHHAAESTAPEAPGTADELVAAADLALYDAKECGRNQVRPG